MEPGLSRGPGVEAERAVPEVCLPHNHMYVIYYDGNN